MSGPYQSWGRYPSAEHDVEYLSWRTDPLPIPAHEDKSFLAFGKGRSYGDACLNDGGVLIDVTQLNRFISFDQDLGILRCEGGVTLEQIIELILPAGWFLPVTPGTKHVTIGGAIANDVHGKNHHRAGSFGNYLRCMEIAHSDGSRTHCSEKEHEELFAATIGGLGLTGVILWAEIELMRVESDKLEVDRIPMRDLDHFLQLSEESDKEYEYTVSWIDCLAPARSRGRGLFIRANHARDRTDVARRKRGLRVPFELPVSPLNRVSLQAFNKLYFHTRRRVSRVEDLASFFYPLDWIRDWNRLYGPRGFLQYQCVVPEASELRTVLDTIAERGKGSFLAVLKVFGDISSRGLMSFPRKGLTVALDFPMLGTSTLDLLDELDLVVQRCKGAVYPAKDARMSPESFRCFFPNWRQFSTFIDPRFSSGFWRRVAGRPDD